MSFIESFKEYLRQILHISMLYY